MENGFKIHKEEMELFAESILNILEDEETCHKIINSNNINMDYMEAISNLVKKNRYYLSESGWEYTKQVLGIVIKFNQESINISEILKLEGFPDFFWKKLFEYLGYEINFDSTYNVTEDLLELDETTPLIKIDTKTNQIYLSINLKKFKLPDLFSKHLVQSFSGANSRVYFNQIYDFKATYSGKKLNDKDNCTC